MPEDGLVSARRFEADIAGFLRSIGLRNVGSGQQNVIGGVQIDASGGIRDCFIAVECHTSIEARRKSIRGKIKEHRGVARQIREGLRENGWARRYPQLRLVIATKNIELSRADRAFASRKPRVYLWDDAFLDYYRQGVAKIGSYAANEVLGELDVRFPLSIAEGELCVPAFKTRLRGRVVYLFYIRPSSLLEIAFVARRERGSEEYYQRFLKKDRITEIGKFLRDRHHQNFFPNNIIVSFRQAVRFVPRRRFGDGDGVQVGWLYLPRSPRSAWIIDGQHRLYGFTQARRALKELHVPVVAFAGLPENRQAEFFLTINKEQKPVDPNLLWDLEGDIHPSSEYGVISCIAKELDTIPPLKDKIYIPRKGAGRLGRHIYLANLCDGIEARALSSPQTEFMASSRHNPLYRRRTAARVDVVARGVALFLSEVARMFGRDWRLGKRGFVFTNNGLNVMLRLYEQLVVHLGHRPQRTEIRTLLRPLVAYHKARTRTREALAGLRAACNGEGGRAQTTLEFLEVIRDGNPGFASPLLTRPSQRDIAIQFEGQARDAVVAALAACDPNWWNDTARVPTPIKTRAIARGPGRGGASPWDGLDLGEVGELIRLGANWRDVFGTMLTPTFRTQTRFTSRFDELVEYRNTLVHAGGHLDPRQQTLFAIYIGEMQQAFRIQSP